MHLEISITPRAPSNTVEAQIQAHLATLPYRHEALLAERASGARPHSCLTIQQWRKHQSQLAPALRRSFIIPRNQPRQPNPMRAKLVALVLAMWQKQAHRPVRSTPSGQ